MRLVAPSSSQTRDLSTDVLYRFLICAIFFGSFFDEFDVGRSSIRYIYKNEEFIYLNKKQLNNLFYITIMNRNDILIWLYHWYIHLNLISLNLPQRRQVSKPSVSHSIFFTLNFHFHNNSTHFWFYFNKSKIFSLKFSKTPWATLKLWGR